MFSKQAVCEASSLGVLDLKHMLELDAIVHDGTLSATSPGRAVDALVDARKMPMGIRDAKETIDASCSLCKSQSGSTGCVVSDFVRAIGDDSTIAQKCSCLRAFGRGGACSSDALTAGAQFVLAMCALFSDVVGCASHLTYLRSVYLADTKGVSRWALAD